MQQFVPEVVATNTDHLSTIHLTVEPLTSWKTTQVIFSSYCQLLNTTGRNETTVSC